MCVCACVCVCWGGGADDTVLVDILPLAEEYQSDHVRLKCETYIGRQTRHKGKELPADTRLLYLLKCEEYSMKEHFETLLGLSSMLSVNHIMKSAHFSLLEPATQVDLFRRRCQLFEQRYGTTRL